ncbi:MAG: DNA alkylation response protein [Gammaproteobacteria bacterium]|nr:MAG: DNA alkylation response protein [Gammaproteobacteria bacterium]
MNAPHHPHARHSLADTHEVENMPPPLSGHNLYTTDQALQEAVVRFQAQPWLGEIRDLGQRAGEVGYQQLGEDANTVQPTFRTHDRYGRRTDEVRFHPAWHTLMREALTRGLHALPWRTPQPGAHVARAALCYLQTQVEAGHGCPVTMTFACVPTLRQQPDLADTWLPKILALDYDPRNVPFTDKKALTIGMAMTEKQGGSDVRTNSTRAYPTGQPGPGQAYELVGHKYFVSAPMSDAFLMLAYTDGGLSCFLVPRWRPDGSKNPIQLQQLKRKMGNASNASAETELRGALGWMVGEEGRGVRTIIEMVALTRFDCMVGSTAGMRQAVAQAIHHCTYRKAFGDYLINQPLMQSVLADLALEQEAALALSFRLAHSLDRQDDEQERLFMRLATAVGKYWICKRTPQHAYEAMECIGGMGVMEDTPMPRLFRESPVNAIWEGSGNVQCLDVLRAMHKSPRTVDAVMAELAPWRGHHALYDRALDRLPTLLRQADDLAGARTLTSQLALLLQAATLYQAGNEQVSEAFVASRLNPDVLAHHYGTLPGHLPLRDLVDRAAPRSE